MFWKKHPLIEINFLSGVYFIFKLWTGKRILLHFLKDEINLTWFSDFFYNSLLFFSNHQWVVYHSACKIQLPIKFNATKISILFKDFSELEEAI